MKNWYWEEWSYVFAQSSWHKVCALRLGAIKVDYVKLVAAVCRALRMQQDKSSFQQEMNRRWFDSVYLLNKNGYEYMGHYPFTCRTSAFYFCKGFVHWVYQSANRKNVFKAHMLFQPHYHTGFLYPSLPTVYSSFLIIILSCTYHLKQRKKKFQGVCSYLRPQLSVLPSNRGMQLLSLLSRQATRSHTHTPVFWPCTCIIIVYTTSEEPFKSAAHGGKEYVRLDVFKGWIFSL